MIYIQWIYFYIHNIYVFESITFLCILDVFFMINILPTIILIINIILY